MTTNALMTEADELADALMLAHEGDALAACAESRGIAASARRRNDAETARVHTLAADAIVAQYPEQFRD